MGERKKEREGEVCVTEKCQNISLRLSQRREQRFAVSFYSLGSECF